MAIAKNSSIWSAKPKNCGMNDRVGSPDVAEIERIPITHKHLSPEPSMIGKLQPRVGCKQLLRLAPSLLQNRPVAPQIGHSQRRQSVLLRSKQVSRSAQVEIHFRKDESIGRRSKRIESRTGLLRNLIVDHQTTKSGQLSATHTTSQLV